MMAEDASVFFNTDDFAEPVTIDGVSVNGIFDAEFVVIDFVETKKPVFSYVRTDAPNAAYDSTVVRSGTTYKVKGVQPDETNMINKLILEKQ